MARKPIEIGHVVRLSGEVAGFVVNVTRYGNGRLLPAPRTLLDTSGPAPKPFASPLAALDALAAWKNAPRTVKQLRPTDTVAVPVAPAPKPVLRVARQSETKDASGNLTEIAPKPGRRPKRMRRSKAAPAPKRELPAITKLLPERPTQIIRDRRTKTQALIDMLIASGQATVTRCAEFRRTNLDPKRGGILPAHLDPVTIS